MSVRELEAKCITSFQLNSICDSRMMTRLSLTKLVVRIRTGKISPLLFSLLISGTEMCLNFYKGAEQHFRIF